MSCNGAADGTITISGVSAGASTIIQKDGTGADLSAQTTFGPGTYVITASAPNGNNDGVCAATASVTITEPIAVTVSATFTNVLCNGAADGTITASASAGASITVNGNPYNVNAIYGPGTYTIMASAPDGNGNAGACSATTTVTITEPPLLAATITGTITVCQDGDAPITFYNPMPSAVTITYAISDGANTTTATIDVDANSSNSIDAATNAGGVFTYTIVSAQYQVAPNCPNTIAVQSVVVTVNPNSTISLFSGSDAQTVCINTRYSTHCILNWRRRNRCNSIRIT